MPIPAGFKLNDEGAMPYLVETPGNDLIASSSKFPDTGLRLAKHEKQFRVTVPLAKAVEPGEPVDFKLSVHELSSAARARTLCTIKSYVWTIPVESSPTGRKRWPWGRRDRDGLEVTAYSGALIAHS